MVLYFNYGNNTKRLLKIIITALLKKRQNEH